MSLELLLNVIGAIMTVLIGRVVATRITRAAPNMDADERVTFGPAISPSLFYGILGTAAVFVAPYVGRADQRVTYLMAGLGLCLGLMSLPGLLGRWAVVLTPDGVEGPSRIAVMIWPTRRVFIPWGEMARMGGTAFTFEFVEANDGRRVYWGDHLKGADHLRLILAKVLHA